MTKGKWITVTIIFLIVAGLSYIKYKNNAIAEAKLGPQGKAGAPPPLVITGFVADYSKLSNNLSTNGTIIAGDMVQLQPEVSGRVTFLNIPEGGSVTKGTLLVKLNDADLQAQLKKLQSQLKISESNKNRLDELLKIKGISQLDYDNAINNYNNIIADLELIQSQINKTEIRAPFNGKIGLRNISMGAYVSTATIITTIQNLSVLKMDITVPEKYASIIKINDMMHCKIEGIPAQISAKVIALEPQIDEMTRSLKVRAIIEQPTSNIIPGGYAKIELILEDISNAIMIPSNALIPDAKNKKVIVSAQGKANFVLVETGIRTENEVQILSGISKGDTIVTSGILQVKPKMSLKFSKVITPSTAQ